MIAIPDDLRQRLQRFGQDHVLADWDRLSDQERRRLLDELGGIDLEQLRTLYARRDHAYTVPDRKSVV